MRARGQLVLQFDIEIETKSIIRRVVLILCGGNIDTTLLGRGLERGLAAEGRLIRFCVTVPDRAGGLGELCARIASLGVSIKDMVSERHAAPDVFGVDFTVVCETRNWEHSQRRCISARRRCCTMSRSECFARSGYQRCVCDDVRAIAGR